MTRKDITERNKKLSLDFGRSILKRKLLDGFFFKNKIIKQLRAREDKTDHLVKRPMKPKN
tara:strand:+ start:1769 stop:1948 length:180 start_codon:yes stop_codon:yes gene_type:complete